MSDEISFTTEELLEQAQGNCNFSFLAPIGYFKEHGLRLDDYVAFVARKGAETWFPDLNAIQIARGLARNFASCGGGIRSMSGDESQAQVVAGGWPSAEWLEFYGLSHEEVDLVFAPLCEAIAERFAFSLVWRREGDEFTVTLSRPSTE